MQLNFSSIIVFAFFLALFATSCEKDDDITIEEPPETTIDTLLTTDGIEFVRTPDSYFENLLDWPYAYQYVEIDGLRQAYAEAGPVDGEVVLLLHGQPSWSYLYRKMIPVLADAGYRVIAMDHLGLGRSDKPVNIEDYSYLGHAERLEQFIQEVGLEEINLFAQDWGAIIGLRVAGLNPDWFASIVVGNGTLPVGEGSPFFPQIENPDELISMEYPFSYFTDQQTPFYDECTLLTGTESEEYDIFIEWQNHAMKDSNFRASRILESHTWFPVSSEEEAAYDAPYPSREYMAGIRVFPSLINELSSAGFNQDAWAGLATFDKPFLTIWGGNDYGFLLGSCAMQGELINSIPGANGQAHHRFAEAGHFLQSDQGEEIAQRLIDFYNQEDVTIAPAGFEIRKENEEGELIIWEAVDMTIEEFDALVLPSGWEKNPPRELVFSEGMFSRSPGAEEDGPLTQETLVGYEWVYNAKVIEQGIPIDNQGLLIGNYVDKHHTVTFDAGSIVRYLISPEGDRYVLITRLLNRTSDFFTVPNGWILEEELIEEEWVLELPTPTLNIRTQNQDSFQGPI
jgi:pimeloyl-ACP methyl ester carboxylesterase